MEMVKQSVGMQYWRSIDLQLVVLSLPGKWVPLDLCICLM